MFNYNIGAVPKLMSDLFIKNCFSNTTILKVVVIFTLHLVEVKLAIVHLALIFGIIRMSQNASINVSHSKLNF